MNKKFLIIFTVFLTVFSLLGAFFLPFGLFQPVQVVKADDEILVQRGLITLGNGFVSGEITLDTPVPVGKSFVISSARGTDYNTSRSLALVELTTVVNGEYTKLKATRGSSSGNCFVEWQVITGPKFIVQSGETFMSSVTLTENINVLDLDKSFIVLSSMTNVSSARNSFVRARFISATQIELFVDSSGFATTRWYAVEWEGASVQRGLVNILSDVNTASISAIDLNKAFLSFTYACDASNNPGQAFLRGEFPSATELSFRKGLSSGEAYVSYFVVSHDNIKVQRGLITVFQQAETVILSEAVNTGMSFMPTPQMGNAYISTTDSMALHRGYNTHKLWQDGNITKLTIERTSSTNAINASWFVVEFIPPVVMLTGSDSAIYTVIGPNEPPEAVIACHPQGCSQPEGDCIAYAGTGFCLKNNSTDPQGLGDIVNSIWTIDDYTHNCGEINPSNPVCNITPTLPSGNYTAYLEVIDKAGENATTSKDFTFKGDVMADFDCSLSSDGPWQDCNKLRVSEGEVVYFNNKSVASEGADFDNVNPWRWTFEDGTPSESIEKHPLATFKAFISDSLKQVTLSVIDSKDREDSDSRQIRVTKPLPEWWEIPPF